MLGLDFNGLPTAITAGGPSLSLSQVRLLGIARAKNLIRVVAVNDAVYPCWFADLVIAYDRQWWDYHGTLPAFPGVKASIDDPDLPRRHEDIHYFRKTGTVGFDPDPECLRTGGNSGYGALQVCAHLGAKTILLVGYDMKSAGNHWFGSHPPGVWRRPPVMETRARQFDDLAAPLAELGIRVVNCTPGSGIGAFETGSLEFELSRLES